MANDIAQNILELSNKLHNDQLEAVSVDLYFQVVDGAKHTVTFTPVDNNMIVVKFDGLKIKTPRAYYESILALVRIAAFYAVHDAYPNKEIKIGISKFASCKSSAGIETMTKTERQNSIMTSIDDYIRILQWVSA
jgi:hypothetical protein